MLQTDTIFVMVDQLAIVVPAMLAFDGGKRIELIVARSGLSTEAALGERSPAVSLVNMLRADGPEQAVRLARNGARIVICVATGADRRPELRRLAPTSLILTAATAQQLAEALRAGLGPPA